LICIHGSASNHRVYDRLIDAMPGWDRYAINLPGRAGTEGPPLADAASMADFLSGFVEAEVGGRYVVVGHSLGGAVALEHAISAPLKSLAGIVLLCSGARLRVNSLILQMYEAAAKSSGELPALIPAAFEDGVDPVLVEEAAQHRQLTPVETGSVDWHAADRFDRMDDLERIEVPALIVAGSGDVLTPPKYAEYMAGSILENELHVLAGASHMLVMERAAELAALIGSFLSRL
jgi:pimeloyl-ACP methyl ester carboxylesterase